MNIYLISQNSNNSYDTYDSAVVSARTEDEAKKICPDSLFRWSEEFQCFTHLYHHRKMEDKYGSWVNDLNQISVQLIGETKTYQAGQVILASFNAG